MKRLKRLGCVTDWTCGAWRERCSGGAWTSEAICIHAKGRERLWIHVDGGATKEETEIGRGRNMHEEVGLVCD